jgi:hypothetical protein
MEVDGAELIGCEGENASREAVCDPLCSPSGKFVLFPRCRTEAYGPTSVLQVIGSSGTPSRASG